MYNRILLRRNLADQFYQIIIIKTLAYVLIELRMEFSCNGSTKLRLNNKLSFPYSSNQSFFFCPFSITSIPQAHRLSVIFLLSLDKPTFFGKQKYIFKVFFLQSF